MTFIGLMGRESSENNFSINRVTSRSKLPAVDKLLLRSTHAHRESEGELGHKMSCGFVVSD